MIKNDYHIPLWGWLQNKPYLPRVKVAGETAFYPLELLLNWKCWVNIRDEPKLGRAYTKQYIAPLKVGEHYSLGGERVHCHITTQIASVVVEPYSHQTLSVFNLGLWLHVLSQFQLCQQKRSHWPVSPHSFPPPSGYSTLRPPSWATSLNACLRQSKSD